jgi:ubiquinone/menaquinone biosynthesis C-methylase UbiE
MKLKEFYMRFKTLEEERYFVESSYSELWARTIRKKPITQLHESFIKTLHPRRDDIILEVGTGEGRFMPLVLREKATYVGIDISSKAFKYANDRVSPKNKNLVHFVVAEARHLPFKSKSINKSFCYSMIFYVPDKKRALKEMERVSKEKMLIDFRNSLSPKMFLRNLISRTLNFFLSFLLIRKVLVPALLLITFYKKDLWVEMALKDEKLVAEPKHFFDSPQKILKYFDAPVKIYSASRYGLKRHNGRREWLFKPAIVVEVILDS